MTILVRTKNYDDNGFVCEQHMPAKDTMEKNMRGNWGILW